MGLREFRFEIKGTIDEADEDKARQMLEFALKDNWLYETELKVESVDLFPVYNV